jgi:membrane protease YdiL (CAAX protease family)
MIRIILGSLFVVFAFVAFIAKMGDYLNSGSWDFSGIWLAGIFIAVGECLFYSGTLARIRKRPLEQESASADRRTGQAYVLFGVSWLLVLTVGLVGQMRSMRIGLAMTEVVLILLPAILFVRWKRLPVADALRWRPISLATALLSIAVGITSQGVAGGIAMLSEPLLGELPSMPLLELQTVSDFLWALFIAALLPGLCEETLFRGAIQGVLRPKGPWKGVVITALLFAVYHVAPSMFPPAFLTGIVLGVLVLRTGSTVSAILAHAAINAMALGGAYLYRDQPDSASYLLIGGLAAAFCVVFPVFWFHTRGIDTTPSALAAAPAGVRRPGVCLLGFLGASAVVLILAPVAVESLMTELYTVSDGTLMPNAEPGTRLVLRLPTSVEFDLEPGDIISYPCDGKTVLRSIVRAEGDMVWLRAGDIEQCLLKKEITGKVIRIIKPTEPPPN